MLKFALSSLLVSQSLATLFLRDFEDPCVRLCEEFTAERRGAGYNLCDTENLSQCVVRRDGQELCTNLFWSTTEDGQRGLIYDTYSHDESPVSCLEAASTANAFLNPHFHAGLEVFANFRIVQDRLASNTTNVFMLGMREYFGHRLPNVTPQFSWLHELQNHVNVGEAHSVFDIVMAISEAAEMTEVFVDTCFSNQMRCTDCGNLFVENDFTDRIVIEAPITQSEAQVSLPDLLQSRFRLSSSGQCHCFECNRNTDVLCACRLVELGEIFAVQVTSNDHGTVIPNQIDMAQYIVGSESPMLFELVAVVGSRPEASVRREGGIWESVRETTIAEEVENPEAFITHPRTSETFFYQRVGQ